MAEMNDELTDLEKVAITEFELDSEERNAILEETNNILQKVGYRSTKQRLFCLVRNVPRLNMKILSRLSLTVS